MDEKGTIRFGAKEWLGIIASMTTISALTLGCTLWIISVKLEPVLVTIAAHLEQPEIHQTTEQQDARWVTRRELDPHDLEQRLDGCQKEMAVLQYRLDQLEDDCE